MLRRTYFLALSLLLGPVIAYTAPGIANYPIGSQSAGTRFTLWFGGIHGDKKLGIEQVAKTAENAAQSGPHRSSIVVVNHSLPPVGKPHCIYIKDTPSSCSSALTRVFNIQRAGESLENKGLGPIPTATLPWRRTMSSEKRL
jgi:hypothetical protein